MLAGRRIVVGVTGGIAAYKSAHLVRLILEQGAEVRVVMTHSATKFIGVQTLAALTGTPPVSDLFGLDSVSPHTELARWAEAMVVAPATSGFIARLAGGQSDDAVTATVVATTAPVLIAPAMHTEMWEHPATQRNVATLLGDGYRTVGPEEGPLAGGDEGPGRMSEPEDIVAAVAAMLAEGDLEGWRVLVSAGGTREAIDPVRYLGNRSSGKMGRAIADEAAARGAVVTLVTTIPGSGSSYKQVLVESAAEMAEAVWARAPQSDVAVLAAAVADFRPKAISDAKLRRTDGPPELVLEPTPDILEGVVSEESRPFVVGFAAEAGPAADAITKATTKRVDLLVANDITEEGSGFGSDDNRVTIISPDGSADAWDLMPKTEVARRLWDRIRDLRAQS